MFRNLTTKNPLPSLTGLRAFEAMGRLGGATRAAAELSVTHSAISRQVKALEAALGVRLFEGPKSKLTLTADGRSLLAGLTPSFDAISDAVRAVRRNSHVTVAVHNSLAVKWLIPRLPDFERQHPGIPIDLRDLPVEAIRAREADLVVRFLDGPRLGEPGVEVLAKNHIGLVVAPDAINQLATLPRLVAASHIRGWTDWEAIMGQSAEGRPRTLSHLHYVLDAAISGLGVAVLPWILVEDAISAGRLRAPYGFVADQGQLVVMTMSPEVSAAVRHTVAWLRGQALGSARTMPLS
jgi:DNA-binding transcriptional LysR family regulator